MKKQTKRKIINAILIICISVFIAAGLFTYNAMGPFRSLFWNLPTLLGFTGPKTFLVLLQNNYELRPTGGFITAVAEINTLFGFPSIDVKDSYQVPNPPEKIPAPKAFEYLIGQNDPFFAGWTFRDSNFSPDFVQSTQDVRDLYSKVYPDRSIDGVFSIDFSVLERLLEVYGPIEVEGVLFTADNFFIQSQRISKDIDTHDVEQLANRKNILKPFTKALISKIMFSPSKYQQLFRELFLLGQEKHVLGSTDLESVAQKLERLHLDGRIPVVDASQDFLHVNIANIGGRKADRYLTKNISYRADFSNPEQQTSRVEIELEHLGSYNIQSDIYQAYIRTYVPLGSKLLGTSGNTLTITEQSSDLGYTVFADFIRMKPGDQLTLGYTYQLPETIAPGHYQLKVVKQPGTDDQYWNLAIKQMNDSTMLNLAEKTPLSIRENLAFWQGTLDLDQDFGVTLSGDDQGPIILWQKFESLERINVRFNELIDTTTALEKLNYEITDKNEKHEQTDTISITSVQFQDRDLWLTVSGVTEQPEEHYTLKMKNLQDVHGNRTNPDPITRTLIQRIE